MRLWGVGRVGGVLTLLIYLLAVDANIHTSSSHPIHFSRLPTGTRTCMGGCFPRRGITLTGVRGSFFSGGCRIVFTGDDGIRFFGSKA